MQTSESHIVDDNRDNLLCYANNMWWIFIYFFQNITTVLMCTSGVLSNWHKQGMTLVRNQMRCFRTTRDRNTDHERWLWQDKASKNIHNHKIATSFYVLMCQVSEVNWIAINLLCTSLFSQHSHNTFINLVWHIWHSAVLGFFIPDW